MSSRTSSHFGTSRVRVAGLAAAAIVGLAATGRAVGQTWRPTAGGTFEWNDTANWSGGVPNSTAANVSLSPTSALAAAQEVDAQGQSFGSLTIGDPGGRYGQTLTSSGPLTMGTSGGTSVLAVDGPLTNGVVLQDVAYVEAAVNLNNSNLVVVSNAFPSGTSTSPNFQSVLLGDPLSNVRSLAVEHAYVILAAAATSGPGYTAPTTLSGGYATLNLSFDTGSLPTGTAVTLADATDVLSIIDSAQTVGSLAGSGTVALGTGSLTTTANNTTFSGDLSGTGSFTVAGGRTALTGNSTVAANTYPAFTGSVAVNGSAFVPSTLAVNADVALGATSVPVALNGGALESTATFTLNHTVTLGTTGYLTADAGTTLTAAAPVVGGGTLFKEGTGTLVLANAGNAFQGLILDVGTVQFSADADLGGAGGLVRLGGSLELLANDTATTNRATMLTGGSFAVDGGATLTWNGAVIEALGSDELPNHQVLTDNGSGTLVLTNTANNYSGGTVVNGTVRVSDDRDLGSAGTGVTFGYTSTAGRFPVYTPGTLATTANLTSPRPVTLSPAVLGGGGNLSPAAGTTLTLTGTVAGGSTTGGLAVTGPGTVVLSAANTFAGGVYVSAGGTLQVAGDGNLGAAAGGISLAGGTLAWSGFNVATTTARPVDVAVAGGTVYVSGAYTLAMTGPVTDAGQLTKTGPGTLSLLHANAYAGGTVVAAGTLAAGPLPAGFSSNGPLGTGTVTLAGGTLALAGGVAGTPFQQTIAATGYNQDVVVEQSAVNYGSNNYRAAVTTAFDSTNNSSGNAFFETGYNGTTSTGLPHGNQTFTSASNSAVAFTLQPYVGNNTLLVASGNGTGAVSTVGTLTLTTPGVYSSIQVLTAAANGAASVYATLNFTDGTAAAVPIVVPDWYTSTPYAITANGRVSLADGSIQGPSTYPRLFEIDVPVPPASAARAVSSVTFTDASTNAGGTVGVFALSGTGGSLPQIEGYANPVVVTANSTITVAGTPNVSVGNLTIGGSTLTVTGTAGGQLLFGAAATVTGTATINVAPAFTVYVGAVTGGGGLVKANAGTLNIDSRSVLASLNIQGGTVATDVQGSALVTGSLTFAGTTDAWVGRLDLAVGDLIVRSGNLATVTNQIRQAYDNGANDGNGIQLTASGRGTVLGSALAGQLGITAFDGVPVAAADVVVRATVSGDANLDGVVDGSDYARIDAGFAGHLTGYANGDFNYDGVVDASDYTLIDNAFNTQPRPMAGVAPALAGVSTAEISADLSAVPEPMAAGLYAAVAAGLVCRRGRRRRQPRTSRVASPALGRATAVVGDVPAVMIHRMGSDSSTFTKLLNDARNGVPGAADALFPAVYEALRGLAAKQLAGERVDHTLQPTALVNEAYIKVMGGSAARFNDRAHFFCIATRAMRRILIDHAKARGRAKRAGTVRSDLLDTCDLAVRTPPDEMLCIDDAIGRLEESDAEAASVVRMRFYLGLTLEDVAAAIGVSVATVRRDWAYARAYLYRELSDGPG